jgi:hypothetical protein
MVPGSDCSSSWPDTVGLRVKREFRFGPLRDSIQMTEHIQRVLDSFRLPVSTERSNPTCNLLRRARCTARNLSARQIIDSELITVWLENCD